MVTITTPILFREPTHMHEMQLRYQRDGLENFIEKELKVKIARLDKNSPDYEEKVEDFERLIDTVQKHIDFFNEVIEFELSKPQEQRYRELKQYQENKRNGIPGWKVPGELDFN